MVAVPGGNSCRRTVLFDRDKSRLAPTQVVKSRDELLDRASRAVEPLDDDGLKLSPSGVGQEPVELGPVLLRARRHIEVRGHEGQPSLSQMLPDLVELDFKVLGLCAHSGVRGHVHRMLVGRRAGSTAGRQGTTALVGKGVVPRDCDGVRLRAVRDDRDHHRRVDQVDNPASLFSMDIETYIWPAIPDHIYLFCWCNLHLCRHCGTRRDFLQIKARCCDNFSQLPDGSSPHRSARAEGALGLALTEGRCEFCGLP